MLTFKLDAHTAEKYALVYSIVEDEASEILKVPFFCSGEEVANGGYRSQQRYCSDTARSQTDGNSIKILGVDLFSIGLVHPDDASYQVFEEGGNHFRQFIFRDSHLVGAILLGDTRISATLKKLIETNVSCADLLAGAVDAGKIGARIELMT